MADTLSWNISFHWFRRPNASTKRPWSVKILSHNYATSLKLKDIYIPQAMQSVWCDISTWNLRPLIPESLRGHLISRSIKDTPRLIKMMSSLVLIRIQISRHVIVYHVKSHNTKYQLLYFFCYWHLFDHVHIDIRGPFCHVYYHLTTVSADLVVSLIKCSLLMCALKQLHKTLSYDGSVDSDSIRLSPWTEQNNFYHHFFHCWSI